MLTIGCAAKDGCMDKWACNYDVDVTKEDGSCTYADRCYPTNGCMNNTACNYDPGAKQDDGSCTLPPKSGFDCNGKSLAVDSAGTTTFIQSPVPLPLTKGKTYAHLDLPENFEVGFEITPQKTPLKATSSIIHFTATGTVLRESAFVVFRVSSVIPILLFC